MYRKVLTYKEMTAKIKPLFDSQARGLRTQSFQFEGGQLKGEMTAYTGTLPACPHLKWPTRNGRFGENKAQKRSKSRSPHATTGT
jgi:hypothetical protein